MPWLYALCAILLIIVLVLAVKMALLHRALDEICREVEMRMSTDTNTLISVSSGDKHIRRHAAGINTQLRQLRKERHRFQQGNLELREAVTNISHDLRTPLTAIYGYLDLLKREENSTEAVRYIGIIENRAETLKQLMEELFRYSVIASTAGDAVYEDVALNDILEESLAAQFVALTEHGIVPEINMPDNKVMRKLDRGALSRIFENIISNAVKYSDGDLSIVLSESGEFVFSNCAKDLTHVTVGRLFDRFFTVETGRGATGLGLSIAKLLTEQIGGTISAEYLDGRLFITLEFSD